MDAGVGKVDMECCEALECANGRKEVEEVRRYGSKDMFCSGEQEVLKESGSR